MRQSLCWLTALLLTQHAVQLEAQAPRSNEWAAAEREVSEVRALFQRITSDAAAGRLIARDTMRACHDGHDGESVTVWRDRAGRLHKLRWSGHTEHHADTYHFYYDTVGNLRFVFLERAAIDMSFEEERVYFSADGRRLRLLITAAGEGYPFHEAGLVWAPDQWLAAPCSREL